MRMRRGKRVSLRSRVGCLPVKLLSASVLGERVGVGTQGVEGGRRGRLSVCGLGTGRVLGEHGQTGSACYV